MLNDGEQATDEAKYSWLVVYEVHVPRDTLHCERTVSHISSSRWSKVWYTEGPMFGDAEISKFIKRVRPRMETAHRVGMVDICVLAVEPLPVENLAKPSTRITHTYIPEQGVEVPDGA